MEILPFNIIGNLRSLKWHDLRDKCGDISYCAQSEYLVLVGTNEGCVVVFDQSLIQKDSDIPVFQISRLLIQHESRAKVTLIKCLYRTEVQLIYVAMHDDGYCIICNLEIPLKKSLRYQHKGSMVMWRNELFDNGSTAMIIKEFSNAVLINIRLLSHICVLELESDGSPILVEVPIPYSSSTPVVDVATQPDMHKKKVWLVDNEISLSNCELSTARGSYDLNNLCSSHTAIRLSELRLSDESTWHKMLKVTLPFNGLVPEQIQHCWSLHRVTAVKFLTYSDTFIGIWESSNLLYLLDSGNKITSLTASNGIVAFITGNDVWVIDISGQGWIANFGSLIPKADGIQLLDKVLLVWTGDAFSVLDIVGWEILVQVMFPELNSCTPFMSLCTEIKGLDSIFEKMCDYILKLTPLVSKKLPTLGFSSSRIWEIVNNVCSLTELFLDRIKYDLKETENQTVFNFIALHYDILVGITLHKTNTITELPVKLLIQSLLIIGPVLNFIISLTEWDYSSSCVAKHISRISAAFSNISRVLQTVVTIGILRRFNVIDLPPILFDTATKIIILMFKKTSNTLEHPTTKNNEKKGISIDNLDGNCDSVIHEKSPNISSHHISRIPGSPRRMRASPKRRLEGLFGSTDAQSDTTRLVDTSTDIRNESPRQASSDKPESSFPIPIIDNCKFCIISRLCSLKGSLIGKKNDNHDSCLECRTCTVQALGVLGGKIFKTFTVHHLEFSQEYDLCHLFLSAATAALNDVTLSVNDALVAMNCAFEYLTLVSGRTTEFSNRTLGGWDALSSVNQAITISDQVTHLITKFHTQMPYETQLSLISSFVILSPLYVLSNMNLLTIITSLSIPDLKVILIDNIVNVGYEVCARSEALTNGAWGIYDLPKTECMNTWLILRNMVGQVISGVITVCNYADINDEVLVFIFCLSLKGFVNIDRNLSMLLVRNAPAHLVHSVILKYTECMCLDAFTSDLSFYMSLYRENFGSIFTSLTVDESIMFIDNIISGSNSGFIWIPDSLPSAYKQSLRRSLDVGGDCETIMRDKLAKHISEIVADSNILKQLELLLPLILRLIPLSVINHYLVPMDNQSISLCLTLLTQRETLINELTFIGSLKVMTTAGAYTFNSLFEFIESMVSHEALASFNRWRDDPEYGLYIDEISTSQVISMVENQFSNDWTFKFPPSINAIILTPLLNRRPDDYASLVHRLYENQSSWFTSLILHQHCENSGKMSSGLAHLWVSASDNPYPTIDYLFRMTPAPSFTATRKILFEREADCLRRYIICLLCRDRYIVRSFLQSLNTLMDKDDYHKSRILIEYMTGVSANESDSTNVSDTQLIINGREELLSLENFKNEATHSERKSYIYISPDQTVCGGCDENILRDRKILKSVLNSSEYNKLKRSLSVIRIQGTDQARHLICDE